MCEPEDHRFLSLLDYRYVCQYKGCEAIWGSLSRDSGLRAHLKEHHSIACNVCGYQLRTGTTENGGGMRNFDLGMKEMGKHYDGHLVENDGMSVHGYRCWICNIRINMKVDTTSTCGFRCSALKWKSSEYVDVSSCKTGEFVDETVLCPELTVVRDMRIKCIQPDQDGLGCEPREEYWRVKRRRYHSCSSDSDTVSIPSQYLVTCSDELMSTSSGDELLGLVTDSDRDVIIISRDVKRRRGARTRHKRSASASHLKRKRQRSGSDTEREVQGACITRPEKLYNSYLMKKSGDQLLDIQIIDSTDSSPRRSTYRYPVGKMTKSTQRRRRRRKRKQSSRDSSDKDVSSASERDFRKDHKRKVEYHKNRLRTTSSSSSEDKDTDSDSSDGEKSRTQPSAKSFVTSSILRNLDISRGTRDKIMATLSDRIAGFNDKEKHSEEISARQASHRSANMSWKQDLQFTRVRSSVTRNGANSHLPERRRSRLQTVIRIASPQKRSSSSSSESSSEREAPATKRVFGRAPKSAAKLRRRTIPSSGSTKRLVRAVKSAARTGKSPQAPSVIYCVIGSSETDIATFRNNLKKLRTMNKEPRNKRSNISTTQTPDINQSVQKKTGESVAHAKMPQSEKRDRPIIADTTIHSTKDPEVHKKRKKSEESITARKSVRRESCSSSRDSSGSSDDSCSTCAKSQTDDVINRRKPVRRISSGGSSDDSAGDSHKLAQKTSYTNGGAQKRIDMIDLISSEEEDQARKKHNSGSSSKKFVALDKLGISKNAQDKILATVAGAASEKHRATKCNSAPNKISYSNGQPVVSTSTTHHKSAKCDKPWSVRTLCTSSTSRLCSCSSKIGTSNLHTGSSSSNACANSGKSGRCTNSGNSKSTSTSNSSSSSSVSSSKCGRSSCSSSVASSSSTHSNSARTDKLSAVINGRMTIKSKTKRKRVHSGEEDEKSVHLTISEVESAETGSSIICIE